MGRTLGCLQSFWGFLIMTDDNIYKTNKTSLEDAWDDFAINEGAPVDDVPEHWRPVPKTYKVVTYSQKVGEPETGVEERIDTSD